MMHRCETKLRRRRALLLLRDALLDPDMVMARRITAIDDEDEEEEYQQQSAKRVVVSKILLHSLRVEMALREWRKSSQICGAVDGEEELGSSSRGRGNSGNVKTNVKTPTEMRVLCTQLGVWFVTLAFAAVACFETVYFFAFEESRESWETEKQHVVTSADVGPFGYTEDTVMGGAEDRSEQTLEVWLRMLGQSLLLWVFVSQPLWILVRHAILPLVCRVGCCQSVWRKLPRCYYCGRSRGGDSSTLKLSVLADLRLVRLLMGNEHVGCGGGGGNLTAGWTGDADVTSTALEVKVEEKVEEKVEDKGASSVGGSEGMLMISRDSNREGGRRSSWEADASSDTSVSTSDASV